MYAVEKIGHEKSLHTLLQRNTDFIQKRFFISFCRLVDLRNTQFNEKLFFRIDFSFPFWP